MRFHKLKAGSEPGTYIVASPEVTEEDIMTMAKQLSRKRLSRGRTISSAIEVKDHLRNLMHEYESEVFALLLLDTKHRILAFRELFYGTIDAAFILVHNHPSGDSAPSQADKLLTERLKNALALIDVRVLDHIVVGTDSCTSLSECGYM